LNKTSENFEQLFELAFQDIYDLAKKVCSSNNVVGAAIGFVLAFSLRNLCFMFT